MLQVILGCLKIAGCRILDVSFGTIRSMFTVKGRHLEAALFGFIEVFIWYVVVRDALNTDAPVLLVAFFYALGYAIGTLIGGKISNRIKGHVEVQVITTGRDYDMLKTIRDEGYAITVIDVNKSEFAGEKYMILAEVDTKQLPKFEKMIKNLDPSAFILIQDAKRYIGGYRSNDK